MGRRIIIIPGGGGAGGGGGFGGGGGGLTRFISLYDTPANYVGAGNYLLKVNSGASAVEFIDGLGKLYAGDSDSTLQTLQHKVSVSGGLSLNYLLLPPQTMDFAVNVDNTTIQINGSDNLERVPNSITVTITKEKTFWNPSGITQTVWVDVCQFLTAATVVYVRGKRTGGTSATLNARRNAGGSGNHVAGIAAGTSWTDGGGISDGSYSSGDYLQHGITAVAGGPTQLAIETVFTMTV